MTLQPSGPHGRGQTQGKNEKTKQNKPTTKTNHLYLNIFFSLTSQLKKTKCMIMCS